MHGCCGDGNISAGDPIILVKTDQAYAGVLEVFAALAR